MADGRIFQIFAVCADLRRLDSGRDEFEFFIRKQDGRPRDISWQWRPANDPYKEGNDVWGMPAPVYRELCNRLRIKRQWR